MPDFEFTKGLTAEALDSQAAALESEIAELETAPSQDIAPSNRAIVKTDNMVAKANSSSKFFTGNGLGLTAHDRRIDLLSPKFKKQFKGPAGGSLHTIQKPKGLMPAAQAKATKSAIGPYLQRKRNQLAVTRLDIAGGGNVIKSTGELTRGKDTQYAQQMAPHLFNDA